MKNSLREIPVVMCVWQRIERLEHTLDMLACQQGVTALPYLWVNNPHPQIQEEVKDIVKRHSHQSITVHYNQENIGGFARFEMAGSLGDHSAAVLIDDDEDFQEDFLATLTAEFQPKTLWGWHALRVTGPEDHERIFINGGVQANICGTGGTIVDLQLFQSPGLWNCPPEFRFCGDLWMSYYATHHLGYQLYKSHAVMGMVRDQKDQTRLFQRQVERIAFLRWAISQGWQYDHLPHPRAGEIAASARVDLYEESPHLSSRGFDWAQIYQQSIALVQAMSSEENR
jgi:hypothetical protein